MKELRDFLQQHVDTLDVNTTISLLAGYGRMDELMHYARCRQDHEAVLEYLLQRGEVRTVGVEARAAAGGCKLPGRAGGAPWRG